MNPEYAQDSPGPDHDSVTAWTPVPSESIP